MIRGKKGICAVGAVVLVSFFVFFIEAFPKVQATSVTFDVNPHVTVSFDSNLVVLPVHPGTNAVTYVDVPFNIKTNSVNGYLALMSVDEDTLADEAGYNETDLVLLTSDNIYTIPTLNNTVDGSVFPNNYWGYSLDGGQTYHGVPAHNAEVLATIEGDYNNGHDAQSLRFGARVSSIMRSGYYSNTVVLTAIAKYVPDRIEDIEYLQEMNDEIAYYMPRGVQYQLKDARDNKYYWIAKMPNDQIWMTQNLDLDLNYDDVLRVDDSDVRSNYTIEAYLSDTIRAVFYDPGNVFYDKEGIKSYDNNLSDDSEKWHTHAGNYYNKVFAYALRSSTGVKVGTEYPESICPKKWRLPSSKDEYVYSIDSLVDEHYGVNSESSDSRIIDDIAILDMFDAPYYFTRTGSYSYRYDSLYDNDRVSAIYASSYGTAFVFGSFVDNAATDSYYSSYSYPARRSSQSYYLSPKSLETSWTSDIEPGISDYHGADDEFITVRCLYR